MRVLVLGISGMLGSTLFNCLTKNSILEVYGTLRSPNLLKYFNSSLHKNIITELDVLDLAHLERVILKIKPDVVVNCVGLVKQLADSKDPLVTLPLNSMLPHQLYQICEKNKARVIHISTDCVFSGKKGMYSEDDISDAEDLYGKSKFIGELNDYENAITLRTSIIGHELNSKRSLVDWFLSQQGQVKGFRQAIFSGLPTIEMVDVIEKYVLTNANLNGLFHLSVEPISKYDLLSLVSQVYKKDITIVPDDALRIDRSLNSDRFRKATGYVPPTWLALIEKMHKHSLESRVENV